MIITIDGPAASGKSSVAKRLAECLKLYYLYTGLLYRAFAYELMCKKSDVLLLEDSSRMPVITDKELDLIDSIVYDYSDDKPRIVIDGQIVTDYLYSEKISQLASIMSAHPKVRERLLPVQRSVAARYDIVADGRDCGTVVFPNADIKFYLTANIDVRVQRIMHDEQRNKSTGVVSRETLKADLERRDFRDQNRLVAPLKVPYDAIVLDNSDLSLDQTVTLFQQVIQEKIR